MHGIRRVIIVGGIAVLAFAWAIVAMGNAAVRDCVLEAAPDPTYEVRLDGQATTTRSTYEFVVTRAQRPVTGARVCLLAEASDMPALAVRDEAIEVGPGRYRLTLEIDEPGPKLGTVLIFEPGRDPVSATLSFEVRP